MRRRAVVEGPDPAIAAHWASELAWWAERAQVDAPLDADELRRYRALHDCPDAGVAVDAILILAFATAEVQASVTAAAHADARRVVTYPRDGSGRLA